MKSSLADNRIALGLSTTQLAHRLGISQSTVVRLEQSERAGTITLESLKRVADALGCTLEYSIRPSASVSRGKPPYKGLKRSRTQQLSRNRSKSKVGEALSEEMIHRCRTLSPSEKIFQSCSLSDLAKELRQCSKMH